ncbi:MAG TPA: hypothetical protein VGQ03_05440 [Nitrososphaera sp.]|jgi:hypothetical protein|nr:hypothetical protein [Nitrososphaera sp.]
MPANHKVSVGWQIVATFVIIANFWAFYRIRKLRKYVVYIVVPEVILATAYGAYVAFSILSEPDFMREARVDRAFYYYGPHYIALNAIGWALQGFAVYLVIIWSREHNRKLDSPAAP